MTMFRKPLTLRRTLLATSTLCVTLSATAIAQQITVEAENFVASGGTFADGNANPVNVYSVNGEQAINYINSGDYAEYDINVATAGIYSVEYLIGTSVASGSEISLFVMDSGSFQNQGASTVPQGNWDIFQALAGPASVTLPSGTSRVRIEGSGSNSWQWNLESFVFNFESSGANNGGNNGGNAVLLTVEAENYSSVSGTYADGQPNPISVYTTNGVSAINYVNSGDAAEYNVNVPEAGTYTLTYSIGTAMTNGAEIEFLVNNASQGTTTVPATGWDNFQNLTASHTVSLAQGSQTLRVYGSGSNAWQWNLNSFTLEKPGSGGTTDSDGDGVIDGSDSCPNTPAGVSVGSNGCASSQLDSDNDGVSNDVDQCPNTPAGTQVDNVGCAIVVVNDADGDGVDDGIDQCPNTPAGTQVDNVGCPIVNDPDSDGDGVNDSQDQCPNTPSGDVVDAFGCTVTNPTSFTLEAENYDSVGGEIQTYAIPSGGTGVNYFNTGDYLQFNVNIEQDGEYQVVYRVATGLLENVAAGVQSQGLDGNLEVKDVTPVSSQGGDWDAYYDLTGANRFNLYAGANTIRVYGAGSADFQFNVDKVTFTRMGAANPDVDNDGVANAQDQCPNSPSNEAVNTVGCAPSQLDTDGDGITDNIDQCPMTPSTDFVDAVGCSSSGGDDDDFDGIHNSIDQCDTPFGINVNPQGCNVSGSDIDGDGVANNVDQCPVTPNGHFANEHGCSSGQVANPMSANVVVNANIRHEVNGVSDFGRNRHMTMHSAISERDWVGHSDKLNYILSELDIYMGRDNGSSTWRFQETPEDPDRSNKADLDWMVTRGQELREDYDSIDLYKRFPQSKTEMIAGTNPTPLYPTLNWNSNGFTWTGWQPKDTDTSAEWVGHYLSQYYANSSNGYVGEPMPTFWEVINEPDMKLKTGAFMVTNQELLWEYHNQVATEIRNKLGAEAPKIGGMTWGQHDFYRRDGLSRFSDDNYSQWISIPDDPAEEERVKAFYRSRMATTVDDTRNNDWYQWDVMWRGFMEAAGHNMDFYAVHIYDWPSDVDGGFHTLRRGGHVQAMLDMMEWDDVNRAGSLSGRKPIVLSEYGAVQGAWNTQTHQERFDVEGLISFNAMLMQFLERPDYVIKSMPFTPAKPLWGYLGTQDGFTTVGVCGYKDVPDCHTRYHYAMLIEDQINSGNWEWSSFIKFYELWDDVDGTRVDSMASDPDVQVDAYVDGNDLFVIINNLEEFDTTINLNVAGINNANISNVEMRHLTFSSNKQETLLDRRHMKQAPQTATLGANSTMVLRYTMGNAIAVNQSSVETKYFGDSVSGGSLPHRTSITGGPKTLQVNGVNVPNGAAEAMLRLTVSLFPDADDKVGGHLTIDSLKVNGTTVTPPIDWRGPARNNPERIFMTMEIPVPVSALQTNNSIEVDFHHNGELTVANIVVWDFSTTPVR